MECCRSFKLLDVPLCLIGENGIVGRRIPSNRVVYMIVANLGEFISPIHIYLLPSFVGLELLHFAV